MCYLLLTLSMQLLLAGPHTFMPDVAKSKQK